MFKRILVPVDGSAPCAQAISMAVSLAQAQQAKILLVHVLEQAAYMGGYDTAGASSGHLYEALHASGEQLLKESASTVQAAGVAVEARLVREVGRLGEAIATAAADWNADLAVVGTHGRRGPSRLLLGSGAEQIIRFSRVPVLVVRAQDDGA